MSNTFEPIDCSPPRSSVHGISQARILEWVAIFLSRQSSKPRNWTQVCCISGILLHCRWILYQLSYEGSPGSHSVQIRCSVISKSMWPHGLQHARPPCPSPTPRACSNSCPLSWWCHLTISHPLLSPSLPVFPNESVLHIRWPKYWHFSFSISPSNEYSRLISCRIDWFDILAVQRILKSLLQHHGSKASIFWCSAFLIVQISRSYMTTGKTIPLNRLCQ